MYCLASHAQSKCTHHQVTQNQLQQPAPVRNPEARSTRNDSVSLMKTVYQLYSPHTADPEEWKHNNSLSVSLPTSASKESNNFSHFFHKSHTHTKQFQLIPLLLSQPFTRSCRVEFANVYIRKYVKNVNVLI